MPFAFCLLPFALLPLNHYRAMTPMKVISFNDSGTESQRTYYGLTTEEQYPQIYTEIYFIWINTDFGLRLFFLGTDEHGLKIKTRLRCAMGMALLVKGLH